MDELEEVEQIIDHAYQHGADEDLLVAWNHYVEACGRHPKNKYPVQWWMARQFAEHGFFADAAEVLTEMLYTCPKDDDPDARYVLAEMRWWRDHADSIVWIP